jgi:hypothetical protein
LVFREDLLQAGIGDGRAAFEIALPGRLRDGRPHHVEARVRGSHSGLAGCSMEPRDLPAGDAGHPLVSEWRE